ncbi:hypothetical protein OFR34_01475 [Brachyspira hyodysenteriae]|nr:hypothetical protein [Brachyspira hyodysenteriae]
MGSELVRQLITLPVKKSYGFR